MKLNIAFPHTGGQKTIEIDDERVLQQIYDKRISHEIAGEVIGEDFAGYIFKITGGHDKQGFPMRQGVLASGRVRLLLPVGNGNRRGRTGERNRKSVRGCIVAHDIAVLNLIIVKKGEKDIEGITDVSFPRRLGPKRASKIRKMFHLEKGADVRKYVVRRIIPTKKEGGKDTYKAPKIQRLITPARLQRKRRVRALQKQRREKARVEAAEFAELLRKRRQDLTEKRRVLHSRKTVKA